MNLTRILTPGYWEELDKKNSAARQARFAPSADDQTTIDNRMTALVNSGFPFYAAQDQAVYEYQCQAIRRVICEKHPDKMECGQEIHIGKAGHIYAVDDASGFYDEYDVDLEYAGRFRQWGGWKEWFGIRESVNV